MAIPAIFDLYSKIVTEALSVSKIKLNKCRYDFMIEIFMLYLSIPSWINFLQLGRYSLFGRRQYRALIRLCLHLGMAHAKPVPSILASSISQVSKRPG